MRRAGTRGPEELRSISISPDYLDYAEGSALVTWGRTRILCAVTVLETVPPFRQTTGGGWVTAEYAMLPRKGMAQLTRIQEAVLAPCLALPW